MAGRRTLNKVTLIGNLTDKPELRSTADGVNFSTFNLITDREWVVGGQKRRESMIHNCIAWDKLADICVNLLDKGNLVYVDGRLEHHKYKDANDNEKDKTEIVINEMIRLKGNEYQQAQEVIEKERENDRPENTNSNNK